MPKVKISADEREHFEERYPWEGEEKTVAAPKSRGHGKLLREDLRRLPGEILTEDIEDPDKVHELDPEHVRDDVAIEKYEEAVEGKEPEPEQPRGVPEWRPVRQDFVDMIVLSVMKAMLDSAHALIENGHDHGLCVKHLWFPGNDIRVYELRSGNPPARVDRPEHLKDIDLVVDPFQINERIMSIIKSDSVKREVFMESIRGDFGEIVRQEYLRSGLIL